MLNPLRPANSDVYYRDGVSCERAARIMFYWADRHLKTEQCKSTPDTTPMFLITFCGGIWWTDVSQNTATFQLENFT